MDDDDNLRLKIYEIYRTSAIFAMCSSQQSYTERMTKRRVICNVKRFAFDPVQFSSFIKARSVYDRLRFVHKSNDSNDSF